GHGAHPHQTIDPFSILAHVIMALNSIVSRRLHPFQPAVVSIGTINGGFAQNVIPEKVEITGTFRYANPEIHPQIREEIRRAFEISRNLGGDYDLRFEYGGPPMINHQSAVELLRETGITLLGPENVQFMTPSLGAEDFGAFTEKVPGAMFTLGAMIAGDERLLHHPRFDIDERALPIGTAILADAALKFLRGASQ
ncbi:MAG: M20/M25/M40 family metallo-hydrolase, partial [Chloroflexi bacterium]|nr:M20/M25/M40 family metallo-hydrolase [Chloroflexota bacterium]